MKTGGLALASACGAGDGERCRWICGRAIEDMLGNAGGEPRYAGGALSDLGSSSSDWPGPPTGSLVWTVTCTLDPKKLNKPLPDAPRRPPSLASPSSMW